MDSLVDCKCRICGESFKIKPYEVDRRNMCDKDTCNKESKRLAMKAYRATDKGKATTRFLNLRYKRPDIEKTCVVCGEAFETARANRYICSKSECQEKGKYLRQKRYRAGKTGLMRRRLMKIVCPNCNSLMLKTDKHSCECPCCGKIIVLER